MIVVAGSTGVLGLEVCRRLRQKGKAVRALVRATSNPDRVAALKAAGCETVVGNLRDRKSLDAACRGASVVISTVTSVTTAKEGDSIAGTDSEGNRNLVDAAVAAKAGQFIFVSFDATGVPDCPLVDAKQEVEDHLRKSGLTWTILQPGYFMESWLGPMLFADPAAGTARFYGSADISARYIAVSDVAEVVAQCVDNPKAKNRVIQFGGPEELSQAEALRRFEKAFGRSFSVTTVPSEALEAQWKSAEDPVMRSFSALMLGLSRRAISVPPLPAEFPVKMKTVDEFVRELGGRA
ncbi:MAG TPA: SDR family oxidoreductase [Gemmatimonadaceae bacterium]|nr:SDR family oxidoreductase [Gemmatimonadaceae bacterium]